MALISSNRTCKKERIKTEINAETLAKIHHYCDWAGISDISYFIEEAVLVLAKTKESTLFQKRLKKASNAVA